MNYAKMTKHELIKALKSLQSTSTADRPKDDLERTLHELQVHQLELEMQNRELREAQAALEESRNNYAELYDFAPVGYVTLDEKGRIHEVNLTAAQMLGRPRTRLIGWLLGSYVARADINKFMAHLMACRSKNRGKVITELEMTVKHSGPITVQLITDTVQDIGVKFFRTAITDISARRHAEEALQIAHRNLEIKVQERTAELQHANEELRTEISDRKRAEEQVRILNEELERRVRQRTAQLEALNKELEAFSYSISHDLSAPLRSIDGFSQALLEEYAANLDAPARDYLHRVRAATQRMAQLINDMLYLAKVIGGELRHEPVNLSAMAKLIAAELRQTDPEREVEFVIQDGIMVKGDTSLLHAVIQNLFGNAWKFTRKHPRARIELGAIPAGAEGDGKTAYFVRDDGSGFDMAYAHKLFGAFQRLHATEQFEGSGIGLATVKRIIQRHGGRVWAESEVEKGATFYFTL